jgi:murein DD-endopeptidase MepM/ murein hydrolase activator NlpD
LIVALAVPPAHAASLQQVQRRLEQILTRLSEQRAKLRLLRRKERRLRSELEGIDWTKARADRRLINLSTEHRRTAARARAVSAHLSQTEQRLADRRERLSGRLRDIYKYGRTGYTGILLGADDFSSLVARGHFVARIVRADTAAMDAYAADAARARRLQAALAQDRAYLQTLTAQTEARRREILAQRQAKRAVLQRLQVQRAASERAVRELEKNSRDLEKMIRQAQVVAHRPPVANAHTRFAFLWPARGLLTSGFGWRLHPLFRIWHLHTGVDIRASSGAPVLAAADGRVIYAGWFGGYGKIVAIDHGGGISTLYGHLSSMVVATGDEVHRAQLIGHVGSTGYSNGPHLHFEMRINGRPVDPTKQ